jgi:transposase
MTKADTNGQLKLEQDHAINLLLQGQSDREVAEAVNVSRQTVNQWRNHDAVFVAELNARRQALWGSQTERLRSLISQAVDVLRSDLENEDLRLRQSAAVHILKAVGLYGADLKPTGGTTAEAIEADWREAELKARLTF